MGETMTRTRFALSATALLLTSLTLSPVLQAQATRTWVSGVGDDANPCSRTAPCKTFAGAISKTAANGEISVLDPGGFGAVTITKSITINGEGTLAGILSAGTSGVIINAASTDKVVLRNISINGGGTGLNGIRYLAAKEVLLEDVTIEGLAATGRGIDMSLTATSGTLELRNVTISEAQTGVRATTTSGNAIVNLENVRIYGVGGAAVDTALNAFAIIRNSTFTSCSIGLFASGTGSVINAENNTIAFNSTGVNAAVGSTVRLSNNSIFNNSVNGFVINGTIESTGNNRIAGNAGSSGPLVNVLPVD
jgi:hypothetical protein